MTYNQKKFFKVSAVICLAGAPFLAGAVSDAQMNNGKAVDAISKYRDRLFQYMYFPAQVKQRSPGSDDGMCVLEIPHDHQLFLRLNKVSAGALTEEILTTAFREYFRAYGAEYGGSVGVHQFPSGHALSFLLRYWNRYSDPLALAVVQKTLKAMAEDGRHIPHFGKTLYDRAMMVQVYLEAYQATGDKSYAAAAREISDYVLREMTHPQGGFYSSDDVRIDAQSNERQRPRPRGDGEIFTDSNGLMIAGLAFGAKVLNDPHYLEAAEKNANFILIRLVDEKGRLLHRYRDGEAAISGTVEDYAFFIHGLLGLYEATFDVQYFKEALGLARAMVDRFWDERGGGFYSTAPDMQRQPFVRSKEIRDGALPSGNAFAALDFARLYLMTLDKTWKEKSDQLLKAFSSGVSAYPADCVQMLIAFDFALGPSQEIVFAGEKTDSDIQEMIRQTFGRFLPRKVVLLHPSSGTDKEDIEAVVPFMKGQNPIAGKATAYVCENHVCRMPVHGGNRFREVLDKLR